MTGKGYTATHVHRPGARLAPGDSWHCAVCTLPLRWADGVWQLPLQDDDDDVDARRWVGLVLAAMLLLAVVVTWYAGRTGVGL